MFQKPIISNNRNFLSNFDRVVKELLPKYLQNFVMIKKKVQKLSSNKERASLTLAY